MVTSPKSMVSKNKGAVGSLNLTGMKYLFFVNPNLTLTIYSR